MTRRITALEWTHEVPEPVVVVDPENGPQWAGILVTPSVYQFALVSFDDESQVGFVMDYANGKFLVGKEDSDELWEVDEDDLVLHLGQRDDGNTQ